MEQPIEIRFVVVAEREDFLPEFCVDGRVAGEEEEYVAEESGGCALRGHERLEDFVAEGERGGCLEGEVVE